MISASRTGIEGDRMLCKVMGSGKIIDMEQTKLNREVEHRGIAL